jgi:hypothetical protein
LEDHTLPFFWWFLRSGQWDPTPYPWKSTSDKNFPHFTRYRTHLEKVYIFLCNTF